MTEAERARERKMGADFANLELRADMDRYLVNDPLARLGYDPERVQWFDVPRRTTAFYAPFDVDMGSMLSPEAARNYNQMYPGTNLTVPADTIVMNSVSGLPTLAHEARHRGYDVLEGIAALPDMPPGFNMEGAMDPEQFTEIGDEPFLDETFNLPRGVAGFPEGATTRTMRGTLDTSPAGTVMRGYYDQVQDAAQGVLAARGEPPRAVMQTPQRGNMFYQPTGLGGLFSRIGSFFD